MLLSGPAPGLEHLVNFWEVSSLKGIMDNVKHYENENEKTLAHHAYLVESMSMLLTLSSGVVALRSHHTYRLRRG